MCIYFLLIRIAAFFGHKKARLLVRGQKQINISNERVTVNGKEVPKNAIWFHAASSGEFEQARPIIEQLRRTGYNAPVIVTFFSSSGYELQKNYDLADSVLYLPFATRRNAKRFIKALQPKIVIFVKYEFWPAYLRELKAHAIPTYSICAIFRPKQRFFRWWGKSQLALLKCFTHLFVQDEASLQLLQRHGITSCSVAGDTRFDRMALVKNSGIKDSSNDRLTPIVQFIEGYEHVIVAGSTWPKDEELLAKYIAMCNERVPEREMTKLILVPHELDEKHLHFIFNLFQGRMVRYSSMIDENLKLTNESRLHILRQAHILVVDTMGLLNAIYPFGQVAFIGGGFGAGIHNTVEAAVYGKPILFGPNYHHFREAEGLIACGAAVSIANYNELETAMNTAIEQSVEIGAKAAAYVQNELGATDRIYHAIFDI